MSKVVACLRITRKQGNGMNWRRSKVMIELNAILVLLANPLVLLDTLKPPDLATLPNPADPKSKPSNRYPNPTVESRHLTPIQAICMRMVMVSKRTLKKQ